MSITIRAEVLRYQLARRGISGLDLARGAGVSTATVSAALSGRAISARSLQLIAQALTRTPVIDVIDSLLLDDSDAHVLGGL